MRVLPSPALVTRFLACCKCFSVVFLCSSSRLCQDVDDGDFLVSLFRNALRSLNIRPFRLVGHSSETDFDGGDLGSAGVNTDVDDGGNGCGAGNTVTADAAFGTIAGALSLLFSASCVLG